MKELQTVSVVPDFNGQNVNCLAVQLFSLAVIPLAAIIEQFRNIQQPSTAASVTLPLDRSCPNDCAADILSEGANPNVTTSSFSRKLKFLYTNVQSLLSKFDELKIHLCDLSPDVISLTETWLTQHVNDRELALPGYQMFRRDMEGRQGGGVLTYVKNGLNVSDKTDNFSCSSEAIWLSNKVPSSPSLDVLTVYRPPRRDNMAYTRLLEELEKFATRPDTLVMGDFNAPHIDWSSTRANSSEQTFDRSFLNTALKLFLTQHVMLPTRVREGQQANCHDLVLTKSQDSIDEVSCLPPSGKSDHVVLLWDY
nr:unnamed protein product [Spirometra erinaceieuropaei]